MHGVQCVGGSAWGAVRECISGGQAGRRAPQSSECCDCSLLTPRPLPPPPSLSAAGKMSQHLDTLKIGDTIDAKGPLGHVHYLGHGR